MKLYCKLMFISLFSFSFIFPMKKEFSSKQEVSKIEKLLKKQKESSRIKFRSCLLAISMVNSSLLFTRAGNRIYQESGSNTLAQIIIPKVTWTISGMMAFCAMTFYQDEKNIEKQLKDLEK